MYAAQIQYAEGIGTKYFETKRDAEEYIDERRPFRKGQVLRAQVKKVDNDEAHLEGWIA